MSAPPEHSLAPGAGQVDMGQGPGDDQPRKRLRHDEHEVATQQHAITHALPHAYYAANPQAFPEGTLEHLLRAEADPESAHHAMSLQVLAQAQAAQQMAQAAAQHQAAQTAAQQQAAGQQAGPQGQDGNQSEPTGFTYRNRARRKASEKPHGASQIRQSFSKRKRGIAQKAYQLHKITDAKVFLFLANEKGASWAYATPGFGATLSPAHLKMLRQMAMPEIDEAAKEGEQAMTALMPHPPGGENDPDDRNLHVPAGEYHNDPDEPGGQVGDDGGAEHGAHEQAMWAHDPTNQQLQQLQEAAAAMAQQQQHAQQHEYPQSSMAPDLHNGGGMHYIADAASHLAEHPDAQHAQYAMHAPPQEAPHHHTAVHQDAQQGGQPQDYAGTALGAPVDVPHDGAPAIGVPSHMSGGQGSGDHKT